MEKETSMVVAEVWRKEVITGSDAAAGSVALGSCPTTSDSTGVVTKRDHTTFFSVRGLQRVDRAKRVDRVFFFTHDTRVTTVIPAVGFTERNHFTVVPVFELHNLPVRRYTLPLTVFTHVFNDCLVTAVAELACPTFAPNNVAAIINNTDNAAKKDLARAALGTDFTTNIAPSTH
jgi:hypothetical protein